MTFLSRLAALVPRPGVHLLTYHGLLAPAASDRHRVVPEPPEDNDDDSEPCHRPRGRAKDPDRPYRAARRPRTLWANLLARVFRVDVLRCSCGGRRVCSRFSPIPQSSSGSSRTSIFRLSLRRSRTLDRRPRSSTRSSEPTFSSCNSSPPVRTHTNIRRFRPADIPRNGPRHFLRRLTFADPCNAHRLAPVIRQTGPAWPPCSATAASWITPHLSDAAH